MRECSFFAEVRHDPEAAVYYIAGTDFPGLVAEGDTMAALLAKVRVLIPDLLEANAHLI